MKKMSNTNWHELVNQAKKSDQSAITQLYELTNQNAYFVAISMMKNEDDTFDVLQNAYIKAYNKLDTLENPEKFQSWLNQIVSNECKMALRKHKDYSCTKCKMAYLAYHTDFKTLFASCLLTSHSKLSCILA